MTNECGLYFYISLLNQLKRFLTNDIEIYIANISQVNLSLKDFLTTEGDLNLLTNLQNLFKDLFDQMKVLIEKEHFLEENKEDGNSIYILLFRKMIEIGNLLFYISIIN